MLPIPALTGPHRASACSPEKRSATSLQRRCARM